MLSRSDYTIIAINFATTYTSGTTPEAVEIAAIRFSKNGTQLGRYESLVRLEYKEDRREGDWIQYELTEAELLVAPPFYKVFEEVQSFIQQSDLIAWQGHDIIQYIQQCTRECTTALGAFGNARILDLRSYLCGKYNKNFSSKLGKALQEHQISSEGLVRPVVRCMRMALLLQLVQEAEESVEMEGTSFGIFEV